MIIIIETLDDAAGALVALRDWAQESPEIRKGGKAGAVRVEQLQQSILASLRTFRQVRRMVERNSGSTPPPDRPSPVAPRRAAAAPRLRFGLDE